MAELLEIGRVVKAHGLRGEVLVALSTDRLERLDPGSELQTTTATLVVERSRPHQGRHLVIFKGVSSREDAEAIRGSVLLAEPIDDEDVIWVHELVGATVVEADGTARGIVEAVEANPASDLLVLAGGALVPIDFIVTVVDGTITIDAPDGLFDL